jgi:hypothetical protein
MNEMQSRYVYRFGKLPKEQVRKILEKWARDGVAEAACLHRCKVEPDGECPHGKSSWLVVLGYI